MYLGIGAATACLVRLITWGRRHDAGVQRIVLLRPDRVGDVVLSIPAFQAVRQAFPSAMVTAVVTPWTAPILRDHPAVDRVLTVAGDGLWELWRSRATIRGLRASRGDLVIAFEASWACGLLAFLIGAPHRLGWDFRGAGGFFTQRVPFRGATAKIHEVEANLELVRALGIPAPWQPPTLHVSPAAREWLSQWWQQQGWPTSGVWVLIHPGSRSAYTRWAPERFAAIADRLTDLPEAHVLLLAGQGETRLIQRVQSSMRHPSTIVQDLTLEQMAALLERLHLFIGNATGTTHLAAYLGPCVIEIIGGTHPLDCPQRWGVIGERHRIVHKRPEDVIGRPTDTWVGPEGLAHISVEEVWRAIQDVWPQCLQQAGGTPS
jgi:ADP-heptose:LPS heptosyltransferase